VDALLVEELCEVRREELGTDGSDVAPHDVTSLDDLHVSLCPRGRFDGRAGL
jgi:hypothetical protein